MYKQLNILAKSESGVLSQRGDSITFQKDNQKLYKLLGHSSVKTTMIYAHVLNKGLRIMNPLD